MRLELLSKGNNVVGAGRDKGGLASTCKNMWQGRFDRRKRPRDEDALIEFELTPQSSTNSSNSK